ncbi:cupin domain-containing protein [Marinobacterium sediminicola]|uniref:Anti-ECFsigma factor, ChrR n=1 Tax=Marinobacterium sediminicola TaxID=518898 RepID=A0ABY1S2E5_9GAMM|nr:cupin domain-containing protein [Marinobacterium sediminicola]ULG68514.1 cupin domain-containing protein [Marinobacterium sediminicola]SMR76664.1 anti-ECFsigma factor, ChrR [Marinobacterium sediminicola]
MVPDQAQHKDLPEDFNMDFSQRLVIDTRQLEWLPSPAPGVRRKPLERQQRESGHTTSIVEYAAGTAFSSHPHPKGEEIFVLEGVFSDESGDYPAGSYIRNPPGSQHAPFSREGCVIFVKLNQFAADDLHSVSIDTGTQPWLEGIGGLEVMPLHDFEGEHTALVKWPAGERFQPHRHFGGEEILVLSGEFRDEHGCYSAGTWLRSPHLSEHCPHVEEDTIILVKTGHLPIHA